MGQMTGRLGLGAALLLGGCVSSREAGPPPPVQPARPATYSVTGLETVMGRNVRALEGLFGKPDLDVREGTARKLQFISPICVLDTYLYPPRGGGDPIVTYIDARLPDGRDMDRSSCVAALSRREGAR
ncbi:MAG TPA: hypothetical protein VIT45_02565 [Allosphingosinicella sp.]